MKAALNPSIKGEQNDHEFDAYEERIVTGGRTMFLRKILAGALIAAGLIGAVLFGGTEDRVAEATVGFNNPLCFPADAKGQLAQL
ncbi:MAG: hypothetical protein ACREV9_12575 [Burkholderiales bacterium]